MRVIGILGGVASGKSLVADLLRQKGAAVISADAIGHDVLGEPEVKQAIRDRWGAKTFRADGEVDRKAVAGIVFAGTPAAAVELAFLERLTHPRIGAWIRTRLDELAAAGTKTAVLDAAVMLKAGWDRACDRVIFVEASPDVRLARAVSRGWDEASFRAREAAQDSLDQKRSRADVVIDNSGSLAATTAQVERFWNSL